MIRIIQIISLMALLVIGSTDLISKSKKSKANQHGDSPMADSLVFKNRNYFGVFLNRLESSAYYEDDGTQYPDVIGELDADHDSVYTFNNTIYKLGLDISQTFINQPDYCIFGRLSIPFALNDIYKKWASNNDSIGSHSIVYDNSNIPFVSLGLGADYRYSDFYFSAGADLCLSTIGHDTSGVGVEMYDMYYSNLTPYVSAIYRGEKTFVEAQLGYKKYFDSPLSDMLSLKFGVGLISVEQTAFGAYLQYNKSLDKIDIKSRPFDPFQYQYQQENLHLGIYIDILVEKRFLPGISYELTLSGKNALQTGVFRLYTKFILGLINSNENYK